MGRPAYISRDLLVLFLSNTCFALGMMMAAPLFPLFFQHIDATATETGWLYTAAGAVSTLLIVLASLLIERYGGKTILVVCTLVTIPSQIAFSMATHWEHAAPWFILYNGVWGLRLPIQMIMIAQLVKPGEIGRVFGFMNLIWPISNIVSPSVGGYLVDTYGWTSGFHVALAFFVISLLPLLRLRGVRTTATTERRENPYTALFRIQSLRRGIALFSIAELLATTSIGVINLVVPLYLTQRFGLSTMMVGLYFSIGRGVAMFFAQPSSGYLTDKYGGRRLLLITRMVLPLFFVLYPFVDEYPMLLGLFMGIEGFYSATWAPSMSYVIGLVPASMKNTAVSLRQIMIRVGFTVGPFLGGVVWGPFGYAMPFLLTGGIYATSALLTILSSKEDTGTDSEG